MFRIDDNEVIDATMCGGPARYVNHSCNPNCMAEVVSIGEENKIIIIAKRRISRGEEVSVADIFTARNEVGARLCFYTCLWFCSRGGGLPHCMLGYPPGTRHPPSAVHAGIYGQQAGGMHPTGMQSCSTWFLFLSFAATAAYVPFTLSS